MTEHDLSPLDRSLAFTALLSLSPEFADMTVLQASQVITDLLTDWQRSPVTDLVGFTNQWLARNPLVADDRITRVQAAEVLGVHPNTVSNWCLEGLLPSVKTPKGQRRIKRRDVVALKQRIDAGQPVRVEV